MEGRRGAACRVYGTSAATRAAPAASCDDLRAVQQLGNLRVEHPRLPSELPALTLVARKGQARPRPFLPRRPGTGFPRGERVPRRDSLQHPAKPPRATHQIAPHHLPVRLLGMAHQQLGHRLHQIHHNAQHQRHHFGVQGGVGEFLTSVMSYYLTVDDRRIEGIFLF